jgi:diguanylate cyclase (GGDEF)-like protein
MILVKHKENVRSLIMDLFFSNPNQELQKHIDDFNIKYIHLLALVFGISQVLYFLMTLTPYFDVPERLTYQILYLFNSVICLSYYFSVKLFYYKDNREKLWVERAQAVVVVSITSSTVLLSNLDFQYGGDCIMYCLIVLGITTLSLQSPLQTILYHSIAGIIYLSFYFTYQGGFNLAYTIKFVAFIVLCFTSGIVKYKFFADKTVVQIELKNISEEFRQASLKDTLTETKNRRALTQDSYLFCNENCFFLFTDIDHFKDVNDSYGHQNGDLVIKYYANKLCDYFGKEYVYRFGGDEFMVVVPGMNKKASDEALKSLQNSLKDVVFDNESHSFSVSGGYLFNRLGSKNLTFKLEDLLRKLDHALYEVKNNGRGYFIQA